MSMRWVGLIQAFNELPENLPRAIASMRKLCDMIVGYDDASTDGTREWMQSHLDHVIVGEQNDWKSEIAHKKLMLDWIRANANADWILWMDADEELSPPAVRAIRAIESRQDITGIKVPGINLWRSKQHFRVDRSYGNASHLKCWKMRPELIYEDLRYCLHWPQYPPAAKESAVGLIYPDEPMLHYSWDSPEKIRAKHAMYKSLGQSGEDLDRLEDDSGAALVPVDPSWFWPESPR